jgi:hypothetical protein
MELRQKEDKDLCRKEDEAGRKKDEALMTSPETGKTWLVAGFQRRRGRDLTGDGDGRDIASGGEARKLMVEVQGLRVPGWGAHWRRT